MHQMMEPEQIAVLLYAITLGLLVVWSYVMFLGALEDQPRAQAWAVLNHWNVFVVWCISATVAGVGFLTFLECFLFMTRPEGSDFFFALTWVPVSLFLGLSALFAPSLYFGHRVLVMAVLLGVALSAVTMAYFAFELFSATHEAFVLTVLLAVHCVVMDLGVWGISWF